MGSFDFPQEVLLIDTLDITNCIFEDKKTDINAISKQIWEGSRNVFLSSIPAFLEKIGIKFNEDQCSGIKDILHSWTDDNVDTVIFYIPRTSLREIRGKLARRMRATAISEEIENYIIKQVENNLPDISIYNLNGCPQLESIFDIEKLKKELDSDSKGSTQKIYLFGLRYNLNVDEPEIYINNIPIGYENGLIFGSSKIFKNQIKKGYIFVKSDGEVTIDFYDTNKFSSKTEEINEDLGDIDFKQDSLEFALESEEHIVIESKIKEKLIFSHQPVDIGEEKFSPVSSENKKIVTNSTLVNMDSFFIPKDKNLKKVHLLLVNKDGQKIIAGGQYQENIDGCDIIGSLIIDFSQNNISFTNHSNHSLNFVNFEDNFWKLEKNQQSTNYKTGIYTDILSAPDNNVKNNIETDFVTIDEDDIESLIQKVESGKSFIFDIPEIEFNDSNVSFDDSGVFIRYSSFCIAKFDKTFLMNRTTYKMADSGTIIDCFVRLIEKSNSDFEYGGKEYESHRDILGRAISSKSINFEYQEDGLYIERKELSSNYEIQISALSQKHSLKKENDTVLIRKNDLRDLKIDIINKSYKHRPLLEFSLDIE